MDSGGYRGLNFSRPFMGERLPQHVQNLVIRDYAHRHGLTYRLSATEYAMPGCHMMLETVLRELDRLDGIILYSLFQLPEDPAPRRAVYRRILDSGKSLHFAVEDMSITDPADVARIEDIWGIRGMIDRCPGSADALMDRNLF